MEIFSSINNFIEKVECNGKIKIVNSIKCLKISIEIENWIKWNKNRKLLFETYTCVADVVDYF